jgi:glucokinase
MRAARFDTGLKLIERVAEPTRAKDGPDRVMERLLALIARVIPDDGGVRGIGVSVPGPTDPRAGILVHPPNLPGWHNVPLRKIIHERFDVPCYLGNDANVAALAEATHGAAHGCKHVIYLTVSTGIGSGVIEEGHLVVGARGLGGEAGHMILITGDRISSLEKEAAGPAIARKAVARLKNGDDSRIRHLVDGDLEAVTAQIVGQAAAAGDPVAVDLIREAGYTVGLGIVTLMHLFNPEVVVVGGGVTKTGDLLFEPMREAVREHTLDAAYYENVPIVIAALGDDVALIGAAALVTTHGGTHM